MNNDRKEKIRQVIRTHLENRGWPNIPNPDEFVMSELRSIFRTLLRLNLVKYPEWDAFYAAAENQYMNAKLRGE